MFCIAENVKDEQGKDIILGRDYLESNVAIKIAPEWYDVGLYLGVSMEHLDSIKQLTNPCASKCNDMLRIWYRRDMNDTDLPAKYLPTWKNIYIAMCNLDMIGPAEDLKDDIKAVLDSDDFDMNLII